MKSYNNEKAIISLTSWKKRINTVTRTLFSLITKCPGFHIVLVLSEDEFPQKENELPEDLNILANNNFIEILWIKENVKAFKKILFTMDKYRDVPIISADDDCIYKYNYAEELYNEWLKNKKNVVSYKNAIQYGIVATWGCSTLYPPYYFKEYGLKWLNKRIIDLGLDDNYYIVVRKRLKLNGTSVIRKRIEEVVDFMNEIDPLHNRYRRSNIHRQAYSQIDQFINNV